MGLLYLRAWLVTLWEEYLSDDDISRGESLGLAVHHHGPGLRLRAGGGQIGGGRQDVLQLLYPVHPVKVPVGQNLVHHLH